VKTQTVRLIDVFILGPFMIWAGMQLQNDFAKVAMIGSGLATMYYNGNNYLIRRNQQAIGVQQNG
jgi:hypothetical protein